MAWEVEKLFFREYQESLAIHRTHGAGHRNERLQLTKSFLKPPERQFQRFERSGGLSGPPGGQLKVTTPESPKPKLKRRDQPAGPTEQSQSIDARGVSV